MSTNRDIHILVIEDDDSINRLLCGVIRGSGYVPQPAYSGTEALIYLQNREWDLILLDVMLPGLTGEEVLDKIASQSGTPVIVISAKLDRQTKISMLRSGADDYITKPFDSEVLLHKIKAITKRNEEINRENENIQFDLGNYHFNPKLRELSIAGKTQTLSPKENELLKMLAEHKNDLLPRERALKKIWGSDTYFNGRSMDLYIAKLRKYLKEDPNIEIVNIHGNGFRLVAPV